MHGHFVEAIRLSPPVVHVRIVVSCEGALSGTKGKGPGICCQHYKNKGVQFRRKIVKIDVMVNFKPQSEA